MQDISHLVVVLERRAVSAVHATGSFQNSVAIYRIHSSTYDYVIVTANDNHALLSPEI
jgi:hypothetical protein